MMREETLIQIRDDDLERLATNMLITATYWLNYQHLRNLGSQRGDCDLETGIYQVFSHISPYLPAAGQEMLAAVADTYLGAGDSALE